MSASPNAELDCLQRLYRSFAALDEAGMASCYHEEAEFHDPAFDLYGRREVAGMWAMLCQAVRAKGRDVWHLEYSALQADVEDGSAHWEPYYRFSATGRLVHNIIDARFRFRDGLILYHQDRFDFFRWSRQALGPVGWALGWTPLLRGKVRSQARRNLDAFLSRGSRS